MSDTVKYLTNQELIDMPIGQDFVFDIETYKNFLFVAFQRVGANEVLVFVDDDTYSINVEKLSWFMYRHRFIGFKSIGFDMPIIAGILNGWGATEAKEGCDAIIKGRMKPYDFYKKFNLKQPEFNHIDVMEVCPLQGSLKIYGARLKAKRIQDLPYHPSQKLDPQEKINVGNYCINDLNLTELIYQELETQIKLRESMGERYGMDLRSRSDAQIAERVVVKELREMTGNNVSKAPMIAPGSTIKFKKPEFVDFFTPVMKNLLNEVVEAEYTISEGGRPLMPKTLEGRKVTIGKTTYKTGVGGLHSMETTQAAVADDEMMVVDYDVASYYPQIILNQSLYPEHLGEGFLEVYASIVARRLEAKKQKHPDADSLKIVINGLFGKFGSKYSAVYSPQLLLQVTVTGQLSLLMLIEAAESQGFSVVSANTDGLVFRIPRAREGELQKLVEGWEGHTNFTTEKTPYKGLYSRDVNNYIAVKEEGGAKGKGAYGQPKGIFRFHKNPDCEIVADSVVKYLTDGIPVKDTIDHCLDISKFVIVRKVTGGGDYMGEPVGKTARWYWGEDMDCAIYNRKGKLVSKSEGAVLCQEFPAEFPKDVDKARYVEAAEKALMAIGAVKAETDIIYLWTKQELLE